MTVSPFLVLQTRAEARAILYRAFEFDLEEAKAPLFGYALKAGIVDDIGAAATMAIIDNAFNPKPANRECNISQGGDDDVG